MKTFNESGLHPEILDAIQKLGFVTPTPIQIKTIPHILNSNQDLIALAQTGTGKTAAFGLPLVHHIDQSNYNTQSLILCPTRELCLQIAKDLTNFSINYKKINILAVYGGANIETQIKALKNGAHIIVATPGRAVDLINRKKLLLNYVNRVVLDEADEMLSMGFKDDLDTILSETQKDKQTLLFSATMPQEVREITRRYMKNAIELATEHIKREDANVKHIYYVIQHRDRYEVLKRIADLNPNIYGIVFCRTRRETQEVSNKLHQDGYDADALHGDLSQAQRDAVMGKFRSKQLHILVATDVAARGLDVNDLTHVINYNLPDEIEVYVHRSGRTGRAGKKGISIMLVEKRDIGKIRQLEKNSKIHFEKENIPNGMDICYNQLITMIETVQNVEVNEKQIEPFLVDVYQKLENLSREELIKKFVSVEFNRFLTYYKNAKDLNVHTTEADRNHVVSDNSRPKRGTGEYSRLFINMGFSTQLNPARLLGIINDSLDSKDASIGKIDILNNFSFFEIDKANAENLIQNLNNKSIDGIKISIEYSKEKPIGDRGNSRNREFKGKFGGFSKERGGYKGKRERSFDSADRGRFDEKGKNNYGRERSSYKSERNNYSDNASKRPRIFKNK